MLKLFVLGISFAAGVAAQQAPLRHSAASAGQADTPPKPNDYADGKTWLCRPGRQDACAIDHTTTVVAADGKLSKETWTADPNAPIDCFYVYPTISTDPTPNSDMTADPAELNVIKQQFARFASKCKPYAPLYRQVTLVGLRRMLAPGATVTLDQGLQYDDVKDAWNYYLAHDNKGRGVVLVGHSQGSGVLTQLIAKEVDGKPVEKQVISAILMGTRLPIDKGKTTGLFKDFPLCESASQTQCAIAYASFRDTIPPPANSLFGKAPSDAQIAACTNPANLAPGAKGEFHAYLSNVQIANSAAKTPDWVKGKPNPATPFVSAPGLLTGQCVQKNGFSYLEVHVNAVPADPRADDITGDVMANGQVNPAWGLHLIDANLAMGNLVDIVGAESKAYLAKQK